MRDRETKKKTFLRADLGLKRCNPAVCACVCYLRAVNVADTPPLVRINNRCSEVAPRFAADGFLAVARALGEQERGR